MRQLLLISTCLAAIGGTANPALAQEGPEGGADSRYHDQPPSDIIVTAPFERNRRDVLSGVSVLQGPELTQAIRPSIGETLQHTPGVSATSFGPSASRPILRGQQGERVRILTDGIGSIDVSNTSVDHAVVVNPLLAERIEVLRGPEALLYGSSAIGGVVNVIDRRIPRSIPDEPIHADAIATYGSAANERSGAASIEAPLGDKFVIHADGSYLKTDDIKIGGHALAPAARARALQSSLLPPEEPGEEGEEPIDFAGNAGIRGKLPNSASKTWTAGVGAALITDTGNFGIAYSHYDSLYGIPVRYATEPGQEQEAPRLSLLQNRIDARAEIETGGDILQSIRMRYGYANYRHFELEESGEIGTAFYNKGMEGRLELVQAQHGPWKGATGAQFFIRDFNVVGEEAFLPKNSTEQFGIFTLQQLDYGAFKVEAGARYERTALEANPTEEQTQFFSGRRTFDAFSASLGASYGLGDDWRIGANVSRTTRAPSAEELYANGPHAGTEAFEVGSPDFRPERSWGVEAVLRGRGTGYTLEASAYYNWFSNFIYEDLTGEIEDGLPVYQFNQAKARYYGFEVQGSVDLAKFGDAIVVADGLADYVHANIVDVGPAPRIPPLRLLGGLAVKSPKLDVRGEVEWVDDQGRISAFETPTNGYTMVNAEVNVRPWGTERPVSFALSANNIFNVNARRHSSFLKDFAPLAGRDIRVTARVSF
ncbi:TonB-dependent receptor [Sphingobium sp. TA15]|uniref:TonB-dependent receptor-like protein n=1 Tax=Sphingobium indicum (strain DSM 16413 / CCM 7287 / MTCC 6362 / UT26 / NBRC 101211 / UT26S) TaxID=452662 RepID=D4Z292_SPHIU|nr:TonB-dependent receptor [Sphingobium indicum]BAI96724.1 TonB-dependent receptor-like protein [Sphingobium indicum UT26S]BDD66159.1 TonB-dependent receptor [Sphingobium sp. TA15]